MNSLKNDLLFKSMRNGILGNRCGYGKATLWATTSIKRHENFGMYVVLVSIAFCDFVDSSRRNLRMAKRLELTKGLKKTVVLTRHISGYHQCLVASGHLPIFLSHSMQAEDSRF